MFCPWEPAQLFILSSNVPTFLYYSHVVALFSALFFGIYLFISRKDLFSKRFLLLTILLSLWIIGDVLQWATNDPSFLLFFWRISIALEALIYTMAFMLVFTFIKQKESPRFLKIAFLLVNAAFAYFASSQLFIGAVDATYCNAVENNIAVYTSYVYQILVTLGIILVGFTNKNYSNLAKQNIFFSLAFVIFLLAFSSGNIVGSITDNWNIAQIGLAGVPIFIGLIVYVAVQFKSLNIKLISVQALTIAMLVGIGSLLLIKNLVAMRLALGGTFIAILFLGRLLIKAVKKEIEQRERLEQLRLRLEKSNLDLGEANDKLKGLDKLKTEFLSLASHQLRSPLTAIKGYASMLTEDSFGKLSDEQEMAVKRIYTSSQGLVSIVEDLLNVTKIEQGGMKYEFMPAEVGAIITDLYNEMKIPAESKGLELKLDMPKHEKFMGIVDPVKIKQVFLNLVDNSIKYTQKGSVTMKLAHEGDKIVFSVIDTGIGISAETKKKLFDKFSRGTEGGRINTGGSGLGLYLARQIAIAHKGDVSIESEGEGKGSTFKVLLPAAGSQTKEFIMPS